MSLENISGEWLKLFLKRRSAVPKNNAGRLSDLTGIAATILGDLTMAPSNIEPTSIPGPRARLVEINPQEVLFRSPLQSRAPFDPEHDEVDSEFARSVLEHGVVQPILVYRIQEKEDEHPGYGLVSGHRRLDAALFSRLASIPALVVSPAMSGKERDLLTALENLQRKDLGPLEKATLIKRFMQVYGTNQKEVAALMGMSETQVSHLLRLLGAPSEIQEAVKTGTLGVRNSRELTRLPERERRQAFEMRKHGIALGSAIQEIKANHPAPEQTKSAGKPGSQAHRQELPKANPAEARLRQVAKAALDGSQKAPTSPLERLLGGRAGEFRQALEERSLSGQVSEQGVFVLAAIWLASARDFDASLSAYRLLTRPARSELLRALGAIDRLSVYYAQANHGRLSSVAAYITSAVQAYFGG
jgi:ParB family transcriptional regulator, chromosome partitioning protein